MDQEVRQKISQQISQSFLFIWGVFFILFPLFFTTLTTDVFILPKQLLLTGLIIFSLFALGVKMLLDKQVRIKRTPLDVPILLFAAAFILSSVFSVNRADSLIATMAVIFSLISYFIIVNGISSKNAGLFLISTILTGGALSCVIAVANHFKFFLLPFASTRLTTFTTVGSYFDLTLYLALLLPLALYFVLPVFKKQISARIGVFAVCSIVLAGGIVLAVSMLFGSQKPLLLPFDTGFQTAFAAISQDQGRMLQGFFFGSGYGNFAQAFSRFHNASFNANQQLWFLTFSSSSSFVLELLTTTGLIGVVSYLFLLFKIITPVNKKLTNPFYLSLVLFAVASFVLPFTFITVALFFFLTAGYSLSQKVRVPHEYFDIELQFVALKKGVLTFTTLEDSTRTRQNNLTALIAFILLLAFLVISGFYATTYAIADITFQKSLSAANTNNGTLTYKLQSQAITTFPYKSAYYRVFSQTNISLANSLLSLQAGKDSSPSATTQQTALTLVQQAITTARQATVLSPLSVVEWQNLSSVYRTLIGLGQNADQFALAAMQQSVTLDPSNPQEYVTLGGLYFQLQQYDSAIRAFQQAISLKPDYANAYYNLGHTYEQKGDLQSAIAQYQIVKQLVANNQQNSDKITAEINSLQAKIGSGTGSATPKTSPSGSTQEPLSLPQTNQLPSQKNSQQIPLTTPTPAN